MRNMLHMGLYLNASMQECMRLNSSGCPPLFFSCDMGCMGALPGAKILSEVLEQKLRRWHDGIIC